MRKLTREEKFGLGITLVMHVVMLLIAWLMVTQPRQTDRMAFIEVTLGEFQDGTVAEFSREEQQQPETRPDPVETIAEEPQPEPAEEPRPEPQPEEPARDVDLPDQVEEVISEEVVTTPDTDRIDPTAVVEEVEEVEEEEEAADPQPAQQDEEVQAGEEETGDIRGIRGRVDVDQGTGSDPIRSAPFQLEWEGDFSRAAVVQPLPNYVTEAEAVISVRFEVRPDGTVGRLQPIIKAQPELEREVLRTLRTWRFSRLPSNVPQESQFGTVTFRFILE
ncbi:energy transducer TonB [Balneolales bacterium ANBcel1]|nr:energy transducer TonB [Balneolales bacterium ANBcel1]